MPTHEPTLAEFIAGPRRNAYVRFPGFSTLYVRHARRFGREVIDLANIEATYPGNGAFVRLVNYLRTDHAAYGIYVECVMTRRFADKLLKLGFAQANVGLSACFFLSPEMPYELEGH